MFGQNEAAVELMDSPLYNFSAMLACQKVLSENIGVAIKRMNEVDKRFILEKLAQGQMRFFAAKDSIAHSKIYLLEIETRH